MAGTPIPLVALVGVPIEVGAGRRGCVMGPAAYRTAEIAETLAALGRPVRDEGDLAPVGPDPATIPASPARNLAAVSGWARAVKPACERLLAEGALPVFLGGDHALSLGSLAGAAAHAAGAGRPLFVLWLDAHADFNTPETSPSGNMHGMPVAFACGLPGFEAVLGAPLAAPVEPARVAMLGIRSVDRGEHDMLLGKGIRVEDMRRIDEHGVVRLLVPFLEEVAAAGGHLHVSLDVDFLDPGIAPAVGTTVPGGITYREAHLVMELLHESGLVTSLDLVELNPFLDEGGRTARFMVELAASLFGKRVMDRPSAGRWSGAG